MTTMRRLLWLCLVCLITIAGLACTGTCASRANVVVNGSTLVGADMVAGSGVEREEVRSLASRITAVVIDGVGDVEIRDDAAATVTIRADDNILPLLVTRVADGSLHIGVQEGRSFRCTRGPRFVVRIPAVAGIHHQGCGTITALALRGTEVTVGSSGVGTLRVGGTAEAVTLEHAGTGTLDARALRAAAWTIDQSGVGTLHLAGTAQRAAVDTSGSGSVQARDWNVAHLVVEASGVGSIEVGRVQELDATLSGVGSLTYAGHPTILRQSVTGVGHIRSR